MEHARILIIDDESAIRDGLQRFLGRSGFSVETCASGFLALEAIQQREFNLIVTDLRMPGMSGIEVLQSVRTLQPGIPVILITGFASVDTAVEAMKNGAADYITKPFPPELLRDKIISACSRRPESVSEAVLPVRDAGRAFHRFIGTSEEMQKVYRRITHVAATNSTVLITGESGTGKELAAHAIHAGGPRSSRPFVAIDCSSLSESLLESELFGHVKGAFTGAVQTKTGLFKVADGGTLFLDEVSNISLSTQAKLLRTLQERKITPIGGTQPVPIDIHLIAATNRNLKAMAGEGLFREDLYFRLNIIPIDLPPLRERRGDIPLLIRHFLDKYTAETGKTVRGIAPDVMAYLEAYTYPGNVRELENMIERAVVLAETDIIRNEDLELWESGAPPEHLSGYQIPATWEEFREMKRLIREQAVEAQERIFIRTALERSDWNVSRAAKETGILRPNLQSMMKRLGISIHESRHQESSPPEPR